MQALAHQLRIKYGIGFNSIELRKKCLEPMFSHVYTSPRFVEEIVISNNDLLPWSKRDKTRWRTKKNASKNLRRDRDEKSANHSFIE